MCCARRRAASSYTSTPSTVNVTMPHGSTPRSCSVSPGSRASCVAQRRRRARSRAPRWRRCPSRERVVDRRTEPEAVGDAVLPALEPARVVADRDAVAADPLRGVDVEERRFEIGRSTSPAHVEQAGAPRARGGTCGRWPRGSRSRARRRRSGAGPRPGTRRAGTARRRRASTAPTAAAGFTSPPWVGIHEIATRRTRRRASRGGVDRELPVLVVGDDLDAGAGPPRDLEHAMTLLAYSARDVRMRSPGANDDAERVERHVPGPGGVLDQRDLVRRRADERRRPSRRPRRDRSATASAAAYPPMRASSSRCSMTVSTTTRGGSEAPALLRCTTSRHPGVSARAASDVDHGRIRSRSASGGEVLGAPVVPVVGEVAHAGLLVLLDRPQQRVLVDAGLGRGPRRWSPRTPWRSCRAPW